MLTPAAVKALNITSEADLPSGGRFEKDASGKPTGAVTGAQGAIIALFDRLPRPTFDQQVEGTKSVFPRAQSPRAHRRRGSGRQQPGAGRLPGAVQGVARRADDGARRLHLCGQTPGTEFEELKSLTALLPIGFGDEMLRFNGLGERITAAMNNNDRPTRIGQGPSTTRS